MTKPNCTTQKPSTQPKKRGRKKLSTAEVIKRLQGLNGDKFDYSQVEYKGALQKITIKCNGCGLVFRSQYSNHYSNKTGCPNCNKGATKSLSQEDFEAKANVKHSFKYDYSVTEYKNNRERIEVICPLHGIFSQVAKNHLDGYGCPECGTIKANQVGAENGGWGRTRFNELCKDKGEATLYVITCLNDTEAFYKIGITSNDLETRFRTAGYMPYRYTLVFQVQGNPGYIFDLERRLHNLLKKHNYQPKQKFGGYTECFTTIKPVEKLLKQLTTSDQLQLIA